ncbi:hypothetical protein [Natronomonas marina]|jgi:hypothetical protein|uniref:hypothetical protein n=1 Tax=Natronomonas marina TaxID=2961939 RepID=UPI0020C9FC42|nr:hypothetical protein [Natronomonas marina]
MRTLQTLLVVSLVLLAGCSFGAPATDDQTPTTTSTPTPTSATTSTPTATPGTGTELAPGITREGITNPVALMNAHQRVLLEDGFAVDQRVVTTYEGTVESRLALRTVVGPGGEVAFRNGTSTAADANGTEVVTSNDIWLNTTAQVSRHFEGGEVTYDVHERLSPPESLVWFGTVQRDIQFAADAYEVTAVERRDGVRFVTLAVSYDRVGNDGVDDAVGTLLVDERGVIHRAEMNVSYDEGTVYSTTYEVIELGAEPEPPDWLDGVPPSAALDVGLDIFEFDASSIELVHTHGDAAPAGSLVTVVSNGTLYETTLEAPFGDGSRYLWVDADGRLRATAERPADDARPLDTEVTVTVRAPDGGVLFSTSIGRL